MDILSTFNLIQWRQQIKHKVYMTEVQTGSLNLLLLNLLQKSGSKCLKNRQRCRYEWQFALLRSHRAPHVLHLREIRGVLFSQVGDGWRKSMSWSKTHRKLLEREKSSGDEVHWKVTVRPGSRQAPPLNQHQRTGWSRGRQQAAREASPPRTCQSLSARSDNLLTAHAWRMHTCAAFPWRPRPLLALKLFFFFF